MFALLILGFIVLLGAGAVSAGLGPTRVGAVALLIAMSGGAAMFYAVYNMNNTPEVIRANNARATIAAATAAVPLATAESELLALERAAATAAGAVKGGSE